MDTKRAFSIIYDVANMYDSADYVDREREQLMLSELPEEEVVITLGAYMGLSERELAIGTHSLPTSIYKKNPVFDLLSGWHFAELMAGKNGPAHLLKAIFGDKAITSMPTKEEEERVMIESVRARCDAKVLQINAMFPNTYPLHLPVHKFFISTDTFVRKGMEKSKKHPLVDGEFLEIHRSKLELDPGGYCGQPSIRYIYTVGQLGPHSFDKLQGLSICEQAACDHTRCRLPIFYVVI